VRQYPKAICNAAATSLFDILLTPLLVALLSVPKVMGGSTINAIGTVTLQLLLPIILLGKSPGAGSEIG
jgi:sodium/bile acid cotransporter 7